MAGVQEAVTRSGLQLRVAAAPNAAAGCEQHVWRCRVGGRGVRVPRSARLGGQRRRLWQWGVSGAAGGSRASSGAENTKKRGPRRNSSARRGRLLSRGSAAGTRIRLGGLHPWRRRTVADWGGVPGRRPEQHTWRECGRGSSIAAAGPWRAMGDGCRACKFGLQQLQRQPRPWFRAEASSSLSAN